MNRRLYVMCAAALCWGCDSQTPPPASQVAGSQASLPASQPGVSPSTATSRSTSPSKADSAVLYQEDFQKIEIGEAPQEFLVLEGAFAVREMEGNRVLELPGEPLNLFSLLFGPSETDGVAVRARFSGTRKGRRYPSFGVGLGGASGYHLIVSAGKDAIELFKDEEVQASAEYHWTPPAWTDVLLRIRQAGDKQWRIEGKVWPHSSPEPADWMIGLNTSEEPPAGRASVWGSPYAGTPIQFDDLLLTRVGAD